MGKSSNSVQCILKGKTSQLLFRHVDHIIHESIHIRDLPSSILKRGQLLQTGS